MVLVVTLVTMMKLMVMRLMLAVVTVIVQAGLVTATPALFLLLTTILCCRCSGVVLAVLNLAPCRVVLVV